MTDLEIDFAPDADPKMVMAALDTADQIVAFGTSAAMLLREWSLQVSVTPDQRELFQRVLATHEAITRASRALTDAAERYALSRVQHVH